MLFICVLSLVSSLLFSHHGVHCSTTGELFRSQNLQPKILVGHNTTRLPLNRRLSADSQLNRLLLLKKKGHLSYLVEVTIGSSEPEQKFTLLVDTGSAALWIPSVHCHTKFCNARAKFNGSLSRSYHKSTCQQVFKYFDGQVCRGLDVTDDIRLSESLIVKGATFLEAREADAEDDFEPRRNYDGQLGLAFRRLLGLHDYPILLEVMKQQGLIDRLMFSIYLEHDEQLDENGYRQSRGELLFGSQIDSSKFVGDLLFVPLSRAAFWEIRLNHIKLVGNLQSEKERPHQVESLRVCEFGCRAALDTGAFTLFGPKEQVSDLNKALGGQLLGDGMYFIRDCDMTLMPTLVFTIGGREFPLEPEQYLVKIKGTKQEFVGCLSAIVDRGGPRWVLGDIFVGNHYIAFDMEEEQLGVARVRLQRKGLDQISFADIQKKFGSTFEHMSSG